MKTRLRRNHGSPADIIIGAPAFKDPSQSKYIQSTQAGRADTSKMYTTLAASLCFIYFLDNKIFENKLNFYQNPGQSLQFSFVCSIFDKILIFIFYITVEKKASILWFQSQGKFFTLRTGPHMKNIQIIRTLITLIWLNIAVLLVRNMEKLFLLNFFFLT